MSEPNNLLRIDALRLKNFRCFAAFDLELHPELTVIIAENAQGKTALLDALSLALQEFVTAAGRGKQPHGFDRADIHLKRGDKATMQTQLPTEFQVEGEADGEHVSWSRALSKDTFHARTSTKDTKDIRRIARSLADQPGVNDNIPTDTPTILPVVAYYGTGRLYDEHRLTEGKRRLAESSPTRVSAYLDCLLPSSSYKSFSAWFGQKWEQVSDPRFRSVGFEARPENHITAVRDAVSTVLEPTGWTTIVWAPAPQDDGGRIHRPGHIALEHPQKGRIPLTHLSDGVRNMVALVGDLAHRCVRLNPSYGEEAAQRTPGLVLIDEVDMHLHPRWQQSVVSLLREAFPLVQFVLTSHSPQVLSTVSKESIRALRIENGHFIAKQPALQTRGVMSADVLSAIMGVDPVPHVPEAVWMNDYRALIENGAHESEQGRALWASLVTHFAENHPLLLDCQRLIRFQAFKSRNAYKESS